MMEIETGGLLQQALAEEELTKIPNEVTQKVETYFEENFLKPFVESKAIAETYRSSVGEYFAVGFLGLFLGEGRGNWKN